MPVVNESDHEFFPMHCFCFDGEVTMLDKLLDLLVPFNQDRSLGHGLNHLVWGSYCRVPPLSHGVATRETLATTKN